MYRCVPLHCANSRQACRSDNRCCSRACSTAQRRLPGLEVSLRHVLENLFLERQLCYQPPQAPILLPQFLHSARACSSFRPPYSLRQRSARNCASSSSPSSFRTSVSSFCPSTRFAGQVTCTSPRRTGKRPTKLVHFRVLVSSSPSARLDK